MKVFKLRQSMTDREIAEQIGATAPKNGDRRFTGACEIVVGVRHGIDSMLITLAFEPQQKLALGFADQVDS